MIETSISISCTRKQRLKEAAALFGITYHQLCVVLLRKSRKFWNDEPVLRKSVDYQDFTDDKRSRMYLALAVSDYEFAISLRLLFRSSVSFILRKAIDQFLDQIIEEYENKNVSSNYFLKFLKKRHYFIKCKENAGLEYWTIEMERQLE